MERRERFGFWIPAGAVGAIALGVALIPLRALVAASHLAFAFIAFTIVVAELGGRIPAVMTALVAALSLDFFLTEPYLSLSIDKSEDVVAFVALGACGLIAAAFGTRRERLSASAERAARELQLLRRLVDQVQRGGDLTQVLGDLRRAFGLRAMVLRAEGGQVLAASPEGPPTAGSPLEVSLDSFLPSGATRLSFGARGLRLPEGGGRILLATDHGRLSLDVWEGGSQGFDLDEWRTFAIAVSILGLRFAEAPRR
jgi:two-component system sensor histidine kinase KdpD